jgi:hypothetical protein
MTATPDLGLPLIAAQQNQPEITHNEALTLIQALLNGVISAGLSTPPGAPAEGDAYICGTAPTGAWAGRANAVAVYTGGGWMFVPWLDDAGTPILPGARNQGLSVYVRDTATLMIWDGAAWTEFAAGGTSSYDMRFGFVATPGASAIIDTVLAVRSVTYPANLAGSLGQVGTNPNATFAMTLDDDGVTIATITVDTAGLFTFATTGATAQSVAAGSVLTLVAPGTADATVANLAMTLLANEGP